MLSFNSFELLAERVVSHHITNDAFAKISTNISTTMMNADTATTMTADNVMTMSIEACSFQRSKTILAAAAVFFRE